jgi:hypothetical protein
VEKAQQALIDATVEWDKACDAAEAEAAAEKKLRIELDRQLDEMTAKADGLRGELAEANAECDELKAIGEARGNHINARQAELAESQQQTLDALEQRDAANERAERAEGLIGFDSYAVLTELDIALQRCGDSSIRKAVEWIEAAKPNELGLRLLDAEAANAELRGEVEREKAKTARVVEVLERVPWDFERQSGVADDIDTALAAARGEQP